jgi:2,4-dichlorophenol 6-monooxygenase
VSIPASKVTTRWISIGLRAREVSEGGCVLVRPDMHLAWRANGMADDPAAEPLEMMSRILPLPI